MRENRMHFRDLEEYRIARKELEEGGYLPVRDAIARSELVMEENTIYEIDVECEECLKAFWRRKAAKGQE